MTAARGQHDYYRIGGGRTGGGGVILPGNESVSVFDHWEGVGDITDVTDPENTFDSRCSSYAQHHTRNRRVICPASLLSNATLSFPCLRLAAHQKPRHVEVVNGHVFEDTATTSDVLHWWWRWIA